MANLRHAGYWAQRRLTKLRLFYRKTVATQAALKAKALARARASSRAAMKATAKAKEAAFKYRLTRKRVHKAWRRTMKRFLAARAFEARASLVVRNWWSRRRTRMPFRTKKVWAKRRLMKLKLIFARATRKASLRARAFGRAAVNARNIARMYAAKAKAAVIKYNRTKRGVHQAWLGTVKRFIAARRFEAKAAVTTAKFTGAALTRLAKLTRRV